MVFRYQNRGEKSTYTSVRGSLNVFKYKNGGKKLTYTNVVSSVETLPAKQRKMN